MYEGMLLSQLEAAEKIPQGSSFPMVAGDGSGTKRVTKETMVEEMGEGLKIGNLEELQTENKDNLVAAINEAAQSGGGGAAVDILDSKEEIEANTEPEKVAGALAVKEMIGELNDNINGNILTYNESEDAYYIQHGADAVPKKLQGSGTPKRTKIFEGDSKIEHTVNVSNYPEYENFTLENFCIGEAKMIGTSGTGTAYNNNLLKSYNPSTGILTLGRNVADSPTFLFSIQYTVYLIR